MPFGETQIGTNTQSSSSSSACAGLSRLEQLMVADHWMISSARAGSDGGIFRPRAWAVLRLMTSSKVAGC